MGISFGGGSKSKSEPTYWPGQKDAYSNVMNMMSAYMGFPTTTPSTYTSPTYGATGQRGWGGTGYATQPGSGGGGDDYLERLLAGYGGDLSAGLTDLEKQSLAEIGVYQPGELYGAGKQSILDTLMGKYDPLTSPYYSAMRERMLREGEEAVTGARQAGNLYGQLSSTGMANVENRVRAQTASDINAILGALFETERGRQMTALPLAMQYEQYPLSVAGQQLEAGGYERGVSQADLDRQYQEFIRQLTALGIPLEVIMRLIGAPVQTTQTSTKGGTTELSGLENLIPLLIPPATAMCWVAAEIFGGWDKPKTHQARYYIQNLAPDWFRNFYKKHGKRIAKFIHNKPIFKAALKPLFEWFAYQGRVAICLA